MARIGVEMPQSGLRAHLGRGSAIAEQIGFPLILRPSFTIGRRGRRRRLQPSRSSTSCRGARCRSVADPHAARRGEHHRLEGVRARGHARPQRQRRHHLLHREPRSDGRPHRRLDHRRAGPDADRHRIPAACATPPSHHPRHRRRDRRIEHPVRRRSEDRPHGRHRDEPARLALLGARLQGHRASHRQDRRQAGGRLHARRAAERHHPETPASFEPTHRLRGDEDPALRLREVPGRRHTSPPR